MKKYLHHPLIVLKEESYLVLIVVLAASLYFLSGINIDIYSPSMPTIANSFHATVVATKNTISIFLLGWAIGALFFGVLIDTLGRKKILLMGLSLYVIFCLLAMFCHTIHELMIVRFFQGFCLASNAGMRVLIVDSITGKRYTIAILYTSIGYGLGPIVGPFIGALLQYYFSWQANFFFLMMMGAFALLLVFLFVKESIPVRHSLHIMNIAKRCVAVMSNKTFMAAVLIGGIMQAQIMVYPTIGPFIVENSLQRSVIAYGNSALIVGASYLVGSLSNRFLLRYFLPRQIMHVGFALLIIGFLLELLFSAVSTLTLATIMLPIFITCMGTGFIFPNILAANLKKFPHLVGIAMAVQGFMILCSSSFTIFLISHVHIVSLLELGIILCVMALLEIVLFYGFCRELNDHGA